MRGRESNSAKGKKGWLALSNDGRRLGGRKDEDSSSGMRSESQ